MGEQSLDRGPARRTSTVIMGSWSNWKSFPDPRTGGYLSAPLGPGVYQIRNRATGEMALFGHGANCALRMTSLLPEPLGKGGRKNGAKREYILANLPDIEYRCHACSSASDAICVEREVKSGHAYLFAT